MPVGVLQPALLHSKTMSWKNRLLTTLCRLRARKPSELSRILVVSTTALGDTLWATPALANLRKCYPDATIDVLTSPTGEQALRHNPHINELILFQEPMLRHAYSLWRKLSHSSYDAALIFHASQRLALPLCALAKIPRIIGTKGLNKGLDELLTDPIEAQFEHEVERRLRLIKALGASTEEKTLSYFVQEDERSKAKDFFARTIPDSATNDDQVRYNPLKIAMHIGSKEPFRRWPIACFAKLGSMLQKRFDCALFLTGSLAEQSLLQELKTHLPSATILDPSAPIRSLGALLEQMDLLISNDTGPMHLACALNRPTVGIYVSTDPRLCGPHQAPKASVVSRRPTCTPCIKRRCEAPFCFLQIGASEVFAACEDLILQQNSSNCIEKDRNTRRRI